jgi:hypothetical protein
LQLTLHLNDLRKILRFANQLNFGVARQNPADSSPDEFGVVGQKHFYGHWRPRNKLTGTIPIALLILFVYGGACLLTRLFL